jgi:GNAT superfamily N-acetyltransferase
MHRNFRHEVFLQEMKNPFSQFFLLLTEGGVVGFLKTKTFDNQKDTLELERIYLTQTATGKGIGQHAIKFVENLAKQQGKTRVIIKAMDTATDALRFYEKVGFHEISRFQLDFEVMKKEFRGMIVLEKTII